MIGIYKEYWQSIPVLVVVDSAKKEAPLPTITYFHGFTSAKEHNLPLAFLMAEKGYRVLLPDAIFHGERNGDLPSKEMEARFFAIVEQNLKDLAIIYQQVTADNLIEENRFGIAGTSMGGITTAAALTQYDWIEVAAILMGSPNITEYAQSLVENMKKSGVDIPYSDKQIQGIYHSLEKIDLSKQVDKLNERPLFFWHGENDPVVPFDHAYRFYEHMVPHYKNPENIRFLREVKRGHKVSRFAIVETVKWFELQL
ncbi:prolyl oligopeptidase family serine peptidase [Aquibacillus salsiterrae]|uniref:Prolyl oligopeptidase family serine peptidase n=1 Tax=Aquibacillus salsiterrae TaxID=2950439 RepID=A0A9X3WCV5_9BACI|nr:prolyl oligopeptidase family serine peptidase [Aquibacillus salsiterrae]MDC3417222.1 prolyl oligopeptidase family serine peptidase [Aquibacillus salsiterrae]